jgi:hypothetical protein
MYGVVPVVRAARRGCRQRKRHCPPCAPLGGRRDRGSAAGMVGCHVRAAELGRSKLISWGMRGHVLYYQQQARARARRGPRSPARCRVGWARARLWALDAARAGGARAGRGRAARGAGFWPLGDSWRAGLRGIYGSYLASVPGARGCVHARAFRVCDYDCVDARARVWLKGRGGGGA